MTYNIRVMRPVNSPNRYRLIFFKFNTRHIEPFFFIKNLQAINSGFAFDLKT